MTCARLARVGPLPAMVGRVCEDCGGRVVKTMGDGVMCVFAGAEPAVRASRLMQEKNAEQQDPGGTGTRHTHRLPLRARSRKRRRCLQRRVNLAARIAGLANVGQIIITAETMETLPPELAGRARRLQRVPVKGRQEYATICELQWQDADDLTQFGTGTDHGRSRRRCCATTAVSGASRDRAS